MAAAALGATLSVMALSADRPDIMLQGESSGLSEKAESTATAPSVPKSPLRATASSSDLYAYSIYGDNGAPTGMFRTTPAGEMEHMWSPAAEGWHLYNAWMDNGKLCGFVFHQPGGNLDGIKYQEYDFMTGEVTTSTDLDAANYLNQFTQCTYLPEQGLIFGAGRDEKNWSCIKSMNANDFTDVNIIANINYTKYLVAICYNPIDKNVYAVTTRREFVKIDQQTGDYEKIMDLAVPALREDYKQALVYLPTNDEYLFAACLSDYTTIYYRIDLTAGMTLESAQLPNHDVVTNLITTDPGDMEAPLRPEYVGMNFPDGALDGSFTYILPTTLAGGNEAAGTLDWTLCANGETIATGSGDPGQQIVAEASLKQGSYIIEMSAANDGHTGASTKINVFIGKDTPVAPGNVTLEEGKVTWDAVTESVNGGYLDLDDMTYEVYVDNEYLGETKDTSMEYEVDPDVEFMRHQAEVKAICNDIESESGFSNYCVYGSAIALDVFFAPTIEEAELFTTVNSDEPDALTWGWDSWENTFGTSVPQANAQAWLVTPPLRFDDANTIYSLEFDSKIDMWTGGDTGLTVYLGTSVMPADMNKKLIDTFTPTTINYTSEGTIFSVPESGIYRIGFFVESADHSYRTYIKNISVKKTDVSPNAPAACTELKATPAEKGELKATVSFLMPQQNLIGGAYETSTQVSADVVCGENTVTVSGVAGSQQSVEIATVQGVNDISVICSVDGNAGSTAKTTVYTGFDRPAAPRNFKATVGEDNRTVTFTWEAPEEGANGNWFEAKDITYRIGYSQGWWGTTYLDEIPQDTYVATYVYPEGSALTNRSFILTATNVGGTSGEVSQTVVIGEPYQLPASDDFSNGGYTLWPVFIDTPSEEYESAYMLFQAPAYFNEEFELVDHPAIGVFSTATGDQKSRLVLPKFSTQGNKGGVSAHFEMWTGNLMAKSIKLYGRTYGADEAIEIGSVVAGTGWANIWFDLPSELLGKNWVEVYFESEYDEPDTYTMIYSYGFDYTTAVDETSASEASIIVKGNCAYLNNLDGETFAVYTLDGRKVMAGKVTDNQTVVTLSDGAYVISCGNKSAKVIVR